jgi:acyl-[acyl-carrier-protein]-phospholipid O-acyltransferase/long-chain-fatty-acid--[acyl-carrier-protein] ligase
VDLGHKILIQNTVFKVYDGEMQIILTAIVNSLILLPFVLLFSPSGFLSDKYPKNLIMRICAWIAVGLTPMITLFYYMGWFWLAFGMTFLLATQSAIYSPAKYGYIKALAGKHQLASANAMVQATTTTAILAGTFVFSALFEYALAGKRYGSDGELLQIIAPLGWALVACSALELTLCYRLPEQQPPKPISNFDWKEYVGGYYLRTNLDAIFRNPVIWLSIVGLAVFWGISQAVLAAFPAFAKETLRETNTIVIQGVLACAGIGIMFGSLVAGRASANYIETGLIPLGALGVVGTLFLVPQLDSSWLLGCDFLALGALGGLFIVPLNALIQFHARDDQLGVVLAGNNWVQTITMLGFLSLTILYALFGLSTLGLLYLLTLIALLGAIYTVRKLPQSLVRYIATVLITRRYHIEVLGFDNIPEQGAVLLLGNHVSWIDWAIIQIACPRPVRFVMQRELYERWYLNWFLDFFGVIPIASGRSKGALLQINELLHANEVVCLFPEGAISRTGLLDVFQRGYEKTVDDVEGVILPFYLHGLWGSRFSRASSSLRDNHRRGVKRHIIVAFGETLPIETPAQKLKTRVFELSVTAWKQFAHTLEPLPRAWCHTVKRIGSSLAVADSSGATLSGHRALTAVIALAPIIERNSPEQNIGLLLPTTGAGILANMATLMRGKTVVNLNYTAPRQSVIKAIEKADIRIVYTSRRFINKLSQRGIHFSGPLGNAKLFYLEDLSQQLSSAAKLGILLAVKLLPGGMLHRLFGRSISIDSPAAILFSSGSEGEPKGVVLSHKNIMSNIKQVSDVLNKQDDDVMMGSLPLFHAFGMTVTSLMPLIEGIPVVCHPDPTDVLNVAKAIARYRVTLLCATSTLLRLYTKNRRVHPLMLESLRLIIAGAEKLNPDVRDKFELKFNKVVYEGYGATETSPVAAVNVPDKIDTNYWRVQIGNKPSTVGLPVPGSSLRIAHPQTLEELAVGEDGLILIGGIQVMQEYFKDPQKTADVLLARDGITWYKTGDKGHIDEDGFLTVVDRYSRFAKIGGEMISLGAVEEQIAQAFKGDELEIVAVTLPDAQKGEKIILLVAGDIESSSIKSRLIATHCTPQMIPSAVYKIPQVPKLGSGKTDFNTAQKMAIEMHAV